MKEQVTEYNDYVSKLIEQYGPTLLSAGLKLLFAIITLIIGLWIIKKVVKTVGNLMVKQDVDSSLIPFLKSLLAFGLKALLIISVVSMIGIEMTSFVAVLGAAGLAVGLALQGSLSNFAGGVMILIFKPFKVGDFVEGGGHAGFVNEIQIFHTILKTPDNVTIVIPNGNLSNSSITNYSTEEKRRVDNVFGIAYGDNVDQAYSVLQKMFAEDARILKDPEPFMAVTELADSSVNITTRVWVNGADYWGVKFDSQKKVYEEFEKAGLGIPFPQMDVHVHKS